MKRKLPFIMLATFFCLAQQAYAAKRQLKSDIAVVSLKANSAIEVIYTPGGAQGTEVVIEAPEAIINEVDISILRKSSKLSITYDGSYAFKNGECIKAYVRTPIINRFDLSLAASVKVKGRLDVPQKLNKLNVNLTEAASFIASDITAGEFSFNLEGGTTTKINNLIANQTFILHLGGAASFQAEKISAQFTSIVAQGAAHATFPNFYSYTLSIRANGAAVVDIKGSSEEAIWRADGTAAIDGSGFSVKKPQVESYGMATVQCGKKTYRPSHY